MRELVAFLLFVQSWTFAQSRFDGTWQIEDGHVGVLWTPEDYLFLDGMYHCKSSVPKVDVKTECEDGWR